MATTEMNFDGLVGPTHNYAGLSHGNLASMSHRGAVSNPRAAALQGLAKMKALADLGVPQGVFPPHERPALATLRRLGFAGTDAAVLAAAARQAPALLAACSSASNMWVANAATVAPSSDTRDGRVHFTPANLVSNFHRSIEPPQTMRTLRAVFRDEERFAVHDPVPGGSAMGDEGAANHTRLAPAHGQRGLHFFVYGHRALGPRRASPGPSRFASRQSLEASQAVARSNLLGYSRFCFVQQNPGVIDAGVFHNDVISVGNENVFLYHDQAFVNPRRTIAELRLKYSALNRGAELIVIRVRSSRVPLADAVKSYLFNSQLVTVGRGRMVLVVPSDCEETPRVRKFLDELVAGGDTPIEQVRVFPLKESMRNGGGPACLRLRVVLSDAERRLLPPGVVLTETTYAALVEWVKCHYRERLTAADLADPSLLAETRTALDALTQLMGLGSLYPFQQVPGRK